MKCTLFEALGLQKEVAQCHSLGSPPAELCAFLIKGESYAGDTPFSPTPPLPDLGTTDQQWH